MQADLGERVTRMEERVDSELRHMATREDLMAMMVAAGVGVIAAIVALA